jgi:hypothetical protein
MTMLKAIDTSTVPAQCSRTSPKPRKARPSFVARDYVKKLRDDRAGAVADVRRLERELRSALQTVAELDACVAALRFT